MGKCSKSIVYFLKFRFGDGNSLSDRTDLNPHFGIYTWLYVQKNWCFSPFLPYKSSSDWLLNFLTLPFTLTLSFPRFQNKFKINSPNGLHTFLITQVLKTLSLGLSRFPGLFRTCSLIFPGLFSPGNCQNKIFPRSFQVLQDPCEPCSK